MEFYGEGGDDTFVYNPGNSASIAGDGSDTVDGGAGTDTWVVNRLVNYRTATTLLQRPTVSTFLIDQLQRSAGGNRHDEQR